MASGRQLNPQSTTMAQSQHMRDSAFSAREHYSNAQLEVLKQAAEILRVKLNQLPNVRQEDILNDLQSLPDPDLTLEGAANID